MKRHKQIAKRRAELKQLSANTPVVVHSGKYSHESTMVARICELEGVAESMLEALQGYCELTGSGDEYEKTVALMEQFNQYCEKALNSLSTGRDWGDFPVKSHKDKETQVLGSGVFGLSWAEIEAKQGGKLAL